MLHYCYKVKVCISCWTQTIDNYFRFHNFLMPIKKSSHQSRQTVYMVFEPKLPPLCVFLNVFICYLLFYRFFIFIYFNVFKIIKLNLSRIKVNISWQRKSQLLSRELLVFFLLLFLLFYKLSQNKIFMSLILSGYTSVHTIFFIFFCELRKVQKQLILTFAIILYFPANFKFILKITHLSSFIGDTQFFCMFVITRTSVVS